MTEVGGFEPAPFSNREIFASDPRIIKIIDRTRLNYANEFHDRITTNPDLTDAKRPALARYLDMCEYASGELEKYSIRSTSLRSYFASNEAQHRAETINEIFKQRDGKFVSVFGLMAGLGAGTVAFYKPEAPIYAEYIMAFAGGSLPPLMLDQLFSRVNRQQQTPEEPFEGMGDTELFKTLLEGQIELEEARFEERRHHRLKALNVAGLLGFVAVGVRLVLHNQLNY